MKILIEIVMFLIYFCVFMPLGLFFSAIGHDILKLKIDRQADSYWQPREKPANPESYYKQS